MNKTYAFESVITKEPEVYERIAAEECAKMEETLRLVSVENEQNPTKNKPVLLIIKRRKR